MVLTFPNQLTLLRMAFTPLFVIALIYRQPGWALAIFVLAGLTDALDGFLARHLNQKTALGAFLDPMADKILVTAAYILLSIPAINPSNTIPLWLTALVIGRDTIIVIAALIIHLAHGRRSFQPTFWGKTATLFQVAAVFIVLLLNFLERQPSALQAVFVGVLAMTLISGFHYLSTLPRLAHPDV